MQGKRPQQHFVNRTFWILVIILMLALSSCNAEKKEIQLTITPSPGIDQTLFPQQPTDLPTQLPTPTPTVTIEPQVPTGNGGKPAVTDAIVLALEDHGRAHLFLYQPLALPFTQLTNGDFDDRDPVISPDGTKVAFASNRSGYWDIFILDLLTQNTARLTNSPDYDGAPTWSPDGQWISYESYDGKSLNIIIQSFTDPTAAPIQLTQNMGNNYSPAWSPEGREIAFVTDRSGSCEIWSARLDSSDNRFSKIVGESQADYTAPAWSGDGKFLAWTRTENGESQVQVADHISGQWQARTVTIGVDATWSPDQALLVHFDQPNEDYLEALSPNDSIFIFPAIKTPGLLQGMDWKNNIPSVLIEALRTSNSSVVTETASPTPFLTPDLGNRHGLAKLSNVDAPYPYLEDSISQGFNQLREATGKALGWDFLASLDNAALPLSAAPQPAIPENWLLTGRAIAVNSIPLQADWMTVTREDFNGLTYWHIWLRCLNQDGSCGEPQRSSTWDFTARYSSNVQSFEDGGMLDGIPQGYWVDFTALARDYGWERLPAVSNWRAYFSGTLFNQFVYKQGLTWQQAMLELYPSEALGTQQP